ncbi:chorismate mutase [Alloscardovia macacae]|uniref:Chorismate mutase n=1 Tax=Alloscardovia macacae TaxID=1160091 RepID=A0A261F7D3_9BIFI|nr:chorismate mutase [Alloscardovia macacae]OZG54998.1 chorismate mutase [Alloscardovia macacae]
MIQTDIQELADNQSTPAQAIESLRTRIDEIDDEIIRLLARRFEATHEVGVLKAQAGFAALDASREERQRTRLTALAHDVHLDEDIARGYLEFVVTESKKRHKRLSGEK